MKFCTWYLPFACRTVLGILALVVIYSTYYHRDQYHLSGMSHFTSKYIISDVSGRAIVKVSCLMEDF